MAYVYENFNELSHQLRFLLFEMGIGLSQSSVEHYIHLANRRCQARWQQTSFTENGRELIANEAMAMAYHQRWQKELARLASGHSRFWDWLTEEKTVVEQLIFLEQWGSQVCSKSGFSRREVLQYSPEFEARVSLHWLALKKHCANVYASAETYHVHFARQFPKEYQLWADTLRFKHMNPDDYYPVPIHPWQWRNRVQKSLSHLTDHKDLVLVPHLQQTRPAMSLHTMMPLEGSSDWIQLPLDVNPELTNLRKRPVLLRCLQEMLEDQRHDHDSLFLIQDRAELQLDESYSLPGEQHHLAIQLAENPLCRLTSTQNIVPLAALFKRSPLSNKPLLLDLVNGSQLAPEVYFEQYCQHVLYGPLHLLLKYGIVIEAHQQNTLMIVENRRVKGVILKELDRVAISHHTVYQESSRLALIEEAAASHSLNSLCNLFIEVNFNNNLACWIDALSHYYPLSAHQLWQIVADCLRQLCQSLAPESDPQVLLQHRNQLLSYHCISQKKHEKQIKFS